MSIEVEQLIRRYEIEDVAATYLPVRPMAHILSTDDARRHSAHTDTVVHARQQEVRRRFGQSREEWRKALTSLRRLAVTAYRRIGVAATDDPLGMEYDRLGIIPHRQTSS